MMLQRWGTGECVSGVEEVATGGDEKKNRKYQIFFFGLGVFKKSWRGRTFIQWIRLELSSWHSRLPCAAWGAQWAWRRSQPCRPGGRVRAAPRRRWW